MIDSIERVRRLSVRDDWPSCDFCTENFSSGFRFYTDADHGHVVLCICDGCMKKAKQADTGWLKQE